MEEGYIDKFDIERITRAVEQEFVVEQIEKGKYAVKKVGDEDGDPHIVHLKTLYCTCQDYEYNCEPKQYELGDNKMCKHLYHCMFRVHSMV